MIVERDVRRRLTEVAIRPAPAVPARMALTTSAHVTALRRLQTRAGEAPPSLFNLILSMLARVLTTTFLHTGVDLGLESYADAGRGPRLLRQADRVWPWGIEQATTRETDIAPPTFSAYDMTGGGALAMAPLLHAGQLGALAVGPPELVPGVVNGEVVVQERLALALAFDPSAFPAERAAAALQALVHIIEYPEEVWLLAG
jgi:hypothetical protein